MRKSGKLAEVVQESLSHECLVLCGTVVMKCYHFQHEEDAFGTHAYTPYDSYKKQTESHSRQ